MALANVGFSKDPLYTIYSNSTDLPLYIFLRQAASNTAFFMSMMPSSTEQEDTVDLLDSEADKLMNFVKYFNTIIQEPTEVDTSQTKERGTPVICHMTDCAFRLKSFAFRYTKIRNQYETYMEVEMILWEALKCLKRERRDLVVHLKSQQFADELEDAYLTGNADIIMDMMWKRQELLGAFAFLERSIQAYHMGVSKVIRGKYSFARELWAIEHDSKVLMEEINNFQMLFMSTMSILGSGR
ncbi:hypothetical protein SLS53_003875 [Cytospora paraplurivora]|uniref:Uncharacterized protein n=1 Tax=Cytospora paraplurivora TaxID=2898453 RepID=A0AAN9YH61_9PEZI